MMDCANTHHPPPGASGTPNIVNFPPELIDHIHGFAGPENHLNFALTCKRIASSSRNILRRHQQAFELYGVSSDLSPTTVPTLLQEVASDPIVAWNVHTFESWGSRSCWESWTPFLSFYRREQGIIDDDVSMSDNEDETNSDEDVDEGETDGEGDESEDGSEESGDEESDEIRSRESDSEERDFDTSTWNKRIDRYFRREELEKLIQYLREEIGIPDSQAARAWEEIQKGSDGILKVLLFCLCPRLRTLRYASSGQAESNDARARSSSLNWLFKVILICRKKDSWPQGLRALRDVAIGIESGFGADMRQPPNLTISLFHLPSVKSLYIAGGDRLWDEDWAGDDGDEGWELDNGCSSVEHLFFDDCNLTNNSFRNAILQAPKNLITFALRGGQIFGADDTIALLTKEQGKSLEAIVSYDSPFWNDRGILRFKPEGSDGFEKLRCFTLVLSNLLAEALRDPDIDRLLQDGDSESQRTVIREFFMEWFQEKPPKSTEVIVLALSGHIRALPLEDEDIDIFDDAMVGVLESGNYKNLKAIYFGSPGPYSKDCTVGKKSVAAGLKRGVDVYARCNNRPPRHNLVFPTPPEKYDLATGPWASKARAGQVYDEEARRFIDHEGEGNRIFDPCNGRWIII